MAKIPSLFLGVLLGRVHEIRPLDDDKNGNPQAKLVVRQTNPFPKREDNKFDHWIQVWGRTQMNDLDYLKKGSLVLVVFKSFPFNRKYKDSTIDSSQHQSLFIFSFGSLLSGHKKSKEPEEANVCDTPVEVAQSISTEDGIPF